MWDFIRIIIAPVVEYIFVLGGILFLPLFWWTTKEQSKRERVLRRTLQAYAKGLLATSEPNDFRAILTELRQLIDEPEVREIFRKLPLVDLEGLQKENLSELASAVTDLATLPSDADWRAVPVY